MARNAGDWTALTNNLASLAPDARAFYYYGHGTSSGNVIFGGTGSLRASNLAPVLGNSYQPFRPGQAFSITNRKPFKFVFLDGCMTGLGDFPEAFGIPKIVTEASLTSFGMKRRAFMGWSGTVSFNILKTDFIDWSRKFWQTWVDDATGYTITLERARDIANAHRPSVTNSVPLKMYGSHLLTCGCGPDT